MVKLIIISGLPGSGKSTVAEGLAAKLQLPILSVDPIESSIIKAGVKKSFETGLAAYLVVETIASEYLKLGQSVIIDAVSGVQQARDMWHTLAATYNIKLVVIECVLDPALHKQRIESRVRGLQGMSEVTWQNVEDRRKEYLAWTEDRLVLDTSSSVDQNLEKAVDYISKT